MARRKLRTIRAISQAGIPALSEVAGGSCSTTVVASDVGLGVGAKVVVVGSAVEGSDGVGEGGSDGLGVEVGAGVGVDTMVGEGVGIGIGAATGVGVAVGAGRGLGVAVALGTGLGEGVAVAVGVGVAVGTGEGVGVEVGSGVGSGVGVSVSVGSGGGLTTETSTVPDALNPAKSVVVTRNDAVPSFNGVMDRLFSSTTAEATLELSASLRA